jgi:hypothetical protein
MDNRSPTRKEGDVRRAILATILGLTLVAPACESTSDGGSDCDQLFQELDAFRKAHQEKVISGVEESDAELTAYQRERDRLIAAYEDAGCGSITGG